MDYLKKELEEIISNGNLHFYTERLQIFEGIFNWDLDTIKKWNHSNFWKLLGHQVADTASLDRQWERHLYPDDLLSLEEMISVAITRGEGSLGHEGRYYHKNGKIIWLRIKAILYRSANGAMRLTGAYSDISNLKTSEQKFEATLRRYEHLLQGTHIGTWEWNVQTGQMIYNERWANILGYSLSEISPITDKTLAKYTHPEDLVRSNQLLQNHLEGKVPLYRCETRMKHKNGDWIWIMDQGKIVSRNAAGDPEWVTGLHEDITDRKNNELLLLGYKDLLERTNNAANIGVWELDLETKKMYCSAVIQKLANIPNGHHPSLEEAITFFREGRSTNMITAAIKNAIRKGIGFDLELQVVTQRKGILWTRNIGISEFKDGKCSRLYGFFQDIDEKTRANKELIFKEEQFRKIFEYAYVGMALVGLDGKWLRANPSLCEFLGYSEQELLTFKFQDITHPDDLDMDLQLVAEILAGSRESYQLEKRYIHKSNKIVWTLLSVSLVRSGHGRPLHFVSQILDITKRKLAENKVSDLLEVTKEHNARLENFAHIVSHNLRSHSSNLIMLLDLIKHQYPETANNDYFPLLSTAVTNLEDTIGHLNEITVLGGTTRTKLAALNLRRYVKKAIHGIKASLMELDGTVENHTDTTIEIEVVPAYLESILLNLLTNAVKYSDPQRAPQIIIRSQTTTDHTLLSIQDNGLGLDLESHGDKIFGMYKTFHYHPNARGVGLFMVKNQIEAMGGKIQVESRVNIGTTFTLYFKNAKN